MKPDLFRKYLPLSVRFSLLIGLLGLAVFTCFRLLLCIDNRHFLNEIPHYPPLLAYSFLMGLRFDVVATGYLLLLPTVVMMGTEYARLRITRTVLLFTYASLALLYLLSFLICAADIPFYRTFGSRLNAVVFNWFHSPLFIIRMIFQQWAYTTYLLLFLGLGIVFVAVLRRIYQRHIAAIHRAEGRRTFHPRYVVAAVLYLGLLLLGIRGRIDEKSAIVPGTAYFCQYKLLNELGLNPVYTFGQSLQQQLDDRNRSLNLIDTSVAISQCRYYLHIPDTVRNACSPIYRIETNTAQPVKHNVVLVLMEGMCAAYMQRFGNGQQLTPYLDGLATQGLCFDNFYSAGIHTYNGIFSTLYSFPALMRRHTMTGTIIHHYTGLPGTLKKEGYQNIYFTTHDDQFDNVGGFLTANGFDRIVSKADYPSREVLSTLGVPDHYMFQYALPVLDAYAANDQPFLAVMMTASNHEPYIIPPGIPFRPQHREVRGGGVEYADWAISQLMKDAASKPWFSNTIFVFLADHGTWEGDNYGNMAMALNHIPCIIYAPGLVPSPRVITHPGGQVDVFPTVAGLLGLSYVNNTMGVDLLHEQRRWIWFSQDDKIGVLDNDKVYTWSETGQEELFSFRGKEHILAANKATADSMKNFAFSMLQTTQLLLDGKHEACN